MKNEKFWIFMAGPGGKAVAGGIAALIGVIVINVLCDKVNDMVVEERKAEVAIENQPAISVSIKDLADLYVENRVAYMQRYENKRLEIVDIVDEIASVRSIIVSERGAQRDVDVRLKAGQEENVGLLKKGEYVKIIGTAVDAGYGGGLEVKNAVIVGYGNTAWQHP